VDFHASLVVHAADVVIHAAAMIKIPAAEQNPMEAIKTNILGAENIVNAAIENGVKKVVALSTDKASNPANLYGATKLCSDKLMIAGNYLSNRTDTKFSVVPKNKLIIRNKLLEDHRGPYKE
jgi:UDP-N-acetylglucosamine 4,6-dehydratase